MAIQKIKLDLGTVYQKEEGGIYYFRYQVNGARKAISLKTRNQKEANKQSPLLKATSAEIIAAHINMHVVLSLPKRICCFPKHGPSMREVLNALLLIQ